MQFQADILGVPVLRPANTEITAFGAAALAGLGAGVWQSEAELAALWSLERRFEPRMSASESGARRARWARAVERARAWAAPQ
jgi:glycerol kinase